MRRRTEAIVETRTAHLADEWCREWMVRIFGEDAVKAIESNTETFKRGKRKGKTRATVMWKKALTAGFSGHVQRGVRPGVIRVHLYASDASCDQECIGVWVMGDIVDFRCGDVRKGIAAEV